MTALEFLDLLAGRGMLAEGLVAGLRRQVAASKKPVSPLAIAKLLVDKGHLTAFQAKSLLAEAGGEEPVAPSPPPGELPAKPAAEDEPGRAPLEEETAAAEEKDDLGLAPLEEDAPPKAKDAAAAADAQASESVPSMAEPPATSPRAAGAGGDLGGGLLDDLLDDPLLAEEAAAGDPLAPPARQKGFAWPFGAKARPARVAAPAKKKRFKKKTVRANVWDSKLLLIGGGALAVLTIALVVLSFVWFWSAGDKFFEQAQDDYTKGRYGQAIAGYDKFLRRTPRHPRASCARVRRGLAEIRQQGEVARDWEKALQSAEGVLPKIAGEKDFGEVARPELATLLPQIAGGFADKAKAAADKQQIDRARRFVQLHGRAMELINNTAYMPGSFRASQQTKIENIQGVVEDALREINRSDKLAEAVAEINKAAAAGETARAYQVRSTLLKVYPRLEADPRLRKAVEGIAKKLQEKAEVVEEPLAPMRGDRAAMVKASVVLASRTGGAASGVSGRVVYVLAEGSVYGLDATGGGVLWQRPVGYETTSHPRPVDGSTGADAIVVDSRHHELLRVEAQTGKLAWRLPVGEAFAEPVLRDGRILLATRSGRLLDVDASTGRSPRHAVLAQSLSIGPGVDAQRSEIYQVAEHSNVYVLSSDTLRCREVFYLGHKAGAVPVPPVSAKGCLFLVENFGLDRSRLHAITLEPKLKRAQKPLELDGHVVTPMVVYGGRVVLVTDRGVIYIFDVDAADKKKPVREVAVQRSILRENRTAPIISYPLVAGDDLWIGNLGLTKYALQVTLGKISQQWKTDEQDTLLAPLGLCGGVLIHARRRKSLPGVSISAVGADDGRRRWETELAVPAAGEPIFDQTRRKLVSISQLGELYEIDASARLVDKPAATVRSATEAAPFSRRIDLGDGRVVFAGPPPQASVLLYDPANETNRLSLVPLDIPADSLAAVPVPMAGGLLAPSNLGQVFLLNAGTGRPLETDDGPVLPFQPRLEAGVKLPWRRTAVIGDDGRRMVVYDGRRTLYLVGIEPQPRPHLAAVAQTAVNTELAGPLAVCGSVVYGVARREDGDAVVGFQLPSLVAGPEQPLESRAVWGPERVGPLVMVATDSSGLSVFTADGRRRWTTPLPYGPLAGRPLVAGNDFILASVQGTVWRVAGDSGRELAKTDVGRPLGSGAVVVGERLFLSGSDGTVLVIDKL